MKIAKPTEQDYKIFWTLFTNFEEIDERLWNNEIDYETAYSELLSLVKKASFYTGRVVWGGATAIDNACDLNSSIVEFKPEIKKALWFYKFTTLLFRLLDKLNYKPWISNDP
ncbi:MAG: hypothetical protein F6J87_14715 [Spirulina sp. SIO3F2]|nr:hypothetical protein [Spirulina sp. SIO3F2]